MPEATLPTDTGKGDSAVADNALPEAADVNDARRPRPRPVAAAEPIDPAQFGGEGTGGEPDPEALALLQNKNVALDPTGIADIQAGRIDPRVVGVLTKLSQEHKITVTSGGTATNLQSGRGMDIAAIDGEIVGPGSPLAREVASELSTLDPNIRPNEIGSPFAINGPGYFTDAAHQNHPPHRLQGADRRGLEAARRTSPPAPARRLSPRPRSPHPPPLRRPWPCRPWPPRSQRRRSPRRRPLRRPRWPRARKRS